MNLSAGDAFQQLLCFLARRIVGREIGTRYIFFQQYARLIEVAFRPNVCLGTGEENARLARFSPPFVKPSSFVLADHLRSVKFEYLAPAKKPDEPGIWTGSWKGPEWPLGIRIEMWPLEPSPARLQPITVTAPIYVNRNPGVQYADQ